MQLELLRFTCGATPGNLLGASIGAEPLLTNLIFKQFKNLIYFKRYISFFLVKYFSMFLAIDERAFVVIA